MADQNVSAAAPQQCSILDSGLWHDNGFSWCNPSILIYVCCGAESNFIVMFFVRNAKNKIVCYRLCVTDELMQNLVIVFFFFFFHKVHIGVAEV